MKNLYFKAVFVYLCMLASINAFADHTNSVSVDEARQKALYFLSYQPTFVKGRNHAPQKLSDLNLAHQALLKNGQTAYYIFSNEAGGFVIISGDERTEDVLGYSSEGVFDADNMPENMKGWLDEYATQIAYIQEHGLSSPSIRKIQSPASHTVMKQFVRIVIIIAVGGMNSSEFVPRHRSDKHTI